MGYSHEILQAIHNGEYFDGVPETFVEIPGLGERDDFDFDELEAVAAELSLA